VATASKTAVNAKKKSRNQLYQALLRDRCSSCDELTDVVFFDYYTRTGNKRRKKLCIPCKTGVL